jgi:hypothetical protein
VAELEAGGEELEGQVRRARRVRESAREEADAVLAEREVAQAALDQAGMRAQALKDKVGWGACV